MQYNHRMHKSLVSIIIVNWNGLRWLADCFGSLAKQDYKNYEIIFVDNASKDDSVPWVKSHYPNTKIVINKKNLGFADANNVGYELAKGAYVLFLNNDTRVTKTFLSELVKVLERDKTIGGVQSKILLMDHPDTHDSVGAFLTPTGFLYHYGFGKKDQKKYDKEINLYTAKGACMMFRKNVLDAVAINGDIFDPDYFAYFEETDMCHRVWLAGYRIVYAYKSIIYHKMGATSSSMNNAFIQYHSYKNRIRSYMKNFNTSDLLTILPFHLCIVECYSLYVLIHGRFAIWWVIQKAIWWNVGLVKRTIGLRHYVQTKIVNTDYVLMRKIIMHYPDISYYFALLSDISAYSEV